MDTPDSTTTKRCTKCGEVKPFTEFHKHAREKDGLADQCKVCKAAYYQANKERVLQRAKAYREANRERIREWERNYYAENREHVLSYHRKHQRAYNAANKDVCSAIKHRYRARKAQSGGSHTPTDLVAIRAAQTDKRGRLRCWWCGKPIVAWHVEHKIPLARGGSNDAGNLCLSCADCNRRKNARTPGEFIGRLL